MQTSSNYLEELRSLDAAWRERPLLREIYREFYRGINAALNRGVPGVIMELGSGLGTLAEVIPDCTCTDRVSTPWVARVEDAYRLSVDDASLSNLILVDVLHHLRFPGDALREFQRALRPGGRLILLEPCVSALGLVVYGLFHPEPLGLWRTIAWHRRGDLDPEPDDGYAAQGNATRIFTGSRYRHRLTGWRVVQSTRPAAISYVASGGYRGPQLYPLPWLPWLRLLDRIGEWWAPLFATRMLVVLEKN